MLPLRLTPLLHPLLLPLMPNLLRISSLPCRRFFFFFCGGGGGGGGREGGLVTQDICSLFLNEHLFFISPFSPLLMHFALFCMNRINFLAV